MTFSPWKRRAVLIAIGMMSAQAFVACSRCQPIPERPPAPAQERPIHLMAVGDILLGDAATATLEQEGYDYPFREVQHLFQSADLIVGNLEAPITVRTQPIDPEKGYLYKMDRQAVRALKDFGIDLLCLANNHTLDYGVAGMRDTKAALEEAGIGHFGAGENLREAAKGVIVKVAGVRIGFLAFMEPYGAYLGSYNYFAKEDRPGVAPLDKETVRQAAATLRPEVDLLVAFVHWGENYRGVTVSQRKWGRLLAQMGFDLVLGHHPHVAQGLEIVAGVPILYSLGNFTFGTPGRFSRVDPLWRHGWVADIRIIIEGARVAPLRSAKPPEPPPSRSLRSLGSENLAWPVFAARGSGGDVSEAFSPSIMSARVAQIDLIPIEVDNRVVRFQPRPARPDILQRLLPLVGSCFATGGLIRCPFEGPDR